MLKVGDIVYVEDLRGGIYWAAIYLENKLCFFKHKDKRFQFTFFSYTEKEIEILLNPLWMKILK